jgi:HSP20 family protein
MSSAIHTLFQPPGSQTKDEESYPVTAENAQRTQDGPGGEMAPARNGGSEVEQRQRSQPARWNPSALIDEFQEEWARLWSRPFGVPMIRPARLLAQVPLGTPRLDVYEQDGYLVVKAEVPGVKKEDLQVELDNGDIVIQGETRAENEVKDDQYYRMERRLGRFYRRVPLPFDVKPEDIQATLNDGVLEVRIPKPAEATLKGKRIPVK